MDYRFIYLGTSSARLVKIGIATNVPRRWNDIDNSTPGTRERPTFSMRVYFARKWEQVLHRLFRPWSRRHQGSGYTEWFRFGLLRLPCVTVAVLLIMLAKALTWVIQAGIVAAVAAVLVICYYILFFTPA